MDDTMSIHAVSLRYGVSCRTLRHYGDKGLLTSTRDGGGRRVYSRKEVQRLELLLVMRKLGFPLRDIGRMLSGGMDVQLVVMEKRLSTLDAHIHSLRLEHEALGALKRHLEAYPVHGSASCESILEGLLREMVYLPISAERMMPMQAIENTYQWEVSFALDLADALAPRDALPDTVGIVPAIKALRTSFAAQDKALPIIRVRDNPQLPPRHAALALNGEERWCSALRSGEEVQSIIDAISAALG